MKIQAIKGIFLCIFLIGAGIIMGCGTEQTGNSDANLTFQSPSFPEIQGMLSEIVPSLEIGGKTCPLAVDPDTTLSGECNDIPLGTHSYALKYAHSSSSSLIGSVEGMATFESGKSTEISLSSVSKDFDDDGDAYSNLVEVMFGSDPKNQASFPSVPSFSPIVFYPVGSDPSDVALGDLNGDGNLDVITTDWRSDRISVLLGNGGGTLSSPTSYPVGSSGTDPRNPEALVLGDFNGDGDLDVVVINSGAEGNFSGDLAVFLGNGDGTLQAAKNYPTGDLPISIARGDFNGDSRLDVVTADYGSGNLGVFLGNGDGTFQPAVFYNTDTVSSVVVGDVDGDSFLDLVTSVFFAQNISVLLGNGDGTFQAPLSFTVGIINSLGIGDLNSDGRLDLVASIFSSKTIAVLLGNGDGTYQTPILYEAGSNPITITIGDLDNDGNLDVLTENNGGEVVAVLLSNGDGTLRKAAFYNVGSLPTSVSLGDLNGDGKMDLFSTIESSDSVGIYLSQK